MNVVVLERGRSLPSHLIELLRACRALNTTESKVLAAHANLSPATVNAYFQRISEALRTSDRFSSVQQALRLGLLSADGENLLVNGDFIEGNANESPGNSLPWTTVVGWTALCGTPQWVVPSGEGGAGRLHLWGVADRGEAVYQALRPGHRLKPGRTYRFSAEYRFGTVRRDWPQTPRQPMCVDFRIRVSSGPLPAYTVPDEPGRIAELGWLRYARRDPDCVLVPDRPPTPAEIETMRQRGGEHLVRENLSTHRSGGVAAWEWESAVIDWVADASYDTLTIHPTNHLVVGTDRPEAPLELGWGEVRRLRLVDVTPEASGESQN